MDNVNMPMHHYGWALPQQDTCKRTMAVPISELCVYGSPWSWGWIPMKSMMYTCLPVPMNTAMQVLLFFLFCWMFFLFCIKNKCSPSCCDCWAPTDGHVEEFEVSMDDTGCATPEQEGCGCKNSCESELLGCCLHTVMLAVRGSCIDWVTGNESWSFLSFLQRDPSDSSWTSWALRFLSHVEVWAFWCSSWTRLAAVLHSSRVSFTSSRSSHSSWTETSA